MPPETTTTVDDPVDITCALSKISWSVDDEGVCEVEFEARLADLEAAGVDQPTVTGRRPFRVFMTNTDDNSEVDIIRGTLNKPDWLPADGAGNGVADKLIFRGIDRTEDLRAYRFMDCFADDGQDFLDALERRVKMAGFATGDLFLYSPFTYQLPLSPDISAGEWAYLPQRGQSLQEWLDKLFTDNAANWWRGWTPTSSGYKWRAYPNANLSTTYVMKLYESDADALADGALPEVLSHHRIYDLKRYPQEVEANQVIVVGQNVRTKELIFSQYDDTGSQTPGTATASRPSNWKGWVERIIYIEPAIGSQAVADDVRDALAERTTVDRHIAEWVSDFLIDPVTLRPLWTADLVRIYLNGGTNWEEFRITGIPQVTCEREYSVADVAAGAIPVRRATYRGELIAIGP
jgi:hypothetical protein